MPLYLKLGDIKGESPEANHKEWIVVESMSNPIHRSIQGDARGAQRARGTTTLGDIILSRKLDKSSVKIAEAVASGRYFPEAELHLTSVLNGKEESIINYKIFNVLTTSYAFHGTGEQKSPPSEEISLNYTKIEWTYFVFDEQGKPKGKVPAEFDLEKSQGK